MDIMPEAEGTSNPFKTPADLSSYNITLAEFFAQNPKYTNLAVGAFVFHGDRLLIVKRSSHERAFPNRWEVPGGSCDPEDKSILHATARELKEEVGLDVVAFVRVVGQGGTFDEFHSRTQKQRLWIKFSFEVEVEVEQAREQEASGDELGIRVSLDPNEHQAHLWVTESEVRNGEAGGVTLSFVTDGQKRKILEAFDTRSQPLKQGGSEEGKKVSEGQ